MGALTEVFGMTKSKPVGMKSGSGSGIRNEPCVEFGRAFRELWRERVCQVTRKEQCCD